MYCWRQMIRWPESPTTDEEAARQKNMRARWSQNMLFGARRFWEEEFRREEPEDVLQPPGLTEEQATMKHIDSMMQPPLGFFWQALTQALAASQAGAEPEPGDACAPDPNARDRAGLMPIVPGQAGGGSLQKDENYLAKREFAYWMCARGPANAMLKSCFCCGRAFCRSMVVYLVLWSEVFWRLNVCCGVRSCDSHVMSRHLLRCDGLCCVLSRDAMRCHGDVLYYSSTTLYYKVLLQYYAVIESTIPILPCTTKYC